MGCFMRAMTCRVKADGSLMLSFGIRVSWDSDKRRYVVPLGSRSKRGIKIPVFGCLSNDKLSRRTLMQWAIHESIDYSIDGGLQQKGKTRFRLKALDRDDDLSARRSGESVLVRIDLRMRVDESFGVGGWQWSSAGAEECSGNVRDIAIARCSNGKRGRKHLTFDGLVVMRHGERLDIYPQGKHGMRYVLDYSTSGLHLSQTADINQKKIKPSPRARVFERGRGVMRA